MRDLVAAHPTAFLNSETISMNLNTSVQETILLGLLQEQAALLAQTKFVLCSVAKELKIDVNGFFASAPTEEAPEQEESPQALTPMSAQIASIGHSPDDTPDHNVHGVKEMVKPMDEYTLAHITRALSELSAMSAPAAVKSSPHDSSPIGVLPQSTERAHVRAVSSGTKIGSYRHHGAAATPIAMRLQPMDNDKTPYARRLVLSGGAAANKVEGITSVTRRSPHPPLIGATPQGSAGRLKTRKSDGVTRTPGLGLDHKVAESSRSATKASPVDARSSGKPPLQYPPIGRSPASRADTPEAIEIPPIGMESAQEPPADGSQNELTNADIAGTTRSHTSSTDSLPEGHLHRQDSSLDTVVTHRTEGFARKTGPVPKLTPTATAQLNISGLMRKRLFSKSSTPPSEASSDGHASARALSPADTSDLAEMYPKTDRNSPIHVPARLNALSTSGTAGPARGVAGARRISTAIGPASSKVAPARSASTSLHASAMPAVRAAPPVPPAKLGASKLLHRTIGPGVEHKPSLSAAAAVASADFSKTGTGARRVVSDTSAKAGARRGSS